ncbi:MAG: 2-phosphosulfolactate phosphatase [Bacteroidota bacterium]|nr:2-phosphosulfolactate phosphatase [Bacteroidota bacterium]MDP4205005.1 2-phosphosulfolactate phosphatase [Bacteroidota bacterium]
MEQQNQLEVCFTPAIYDRYASDDKIVVVVDILRATSSICAAFENGAEAIIPVSTVGEAREMKKKGYIVASERDGYVLDFADFGNCPMNFTAERVKGKELVYSTTNGTRSVNMASHSRKVVIGSFLNISAIANWIVKQSSPVLILCASWKDRFSLEDAVFAGALCKKLTDSGKFYTICDSALAAMDLWSIASKDLFSYIQKAAQKGRLAEKGLDYCIEYCHTLNTTTVIPVFEKGRLIDISHSCTKFE